ILHRGQCEMRKSGLRDNKISRGELVRVVADSAHQQGNIAAACRRQLVVGNDTLLQLIRKIPGTGQGRPDVTMVIAKKVLLYLPGFLAGAGHPFLYSEIKAGLLYVERQFSN